MLKQSQCLLVPGFVDNGSRVKRSDYFTHPQYTGRPWTIEPFHSTRKRTHHGFLWDGSVQGHLIVI